MITALLLLAAGALAADRAPARCSIVALPIAREPGTTYVVATATSDTLAAPRDGGPTDQRDHLPPELRYTTHGQVVRVGRVHGADSAALERAFARLGRREALVVPWEHDPGCQPMRWMQGARWAPVAAPAGYRLRLRPPATWVDGRPVLDALVASAQPYPFGILAPRPPDAPALTPGEYVALLAALPTWDDLRDRRAEAGRRLDAWERAHPALAARYPAVAILRNARAVLAPR